MGVAAKRSAQKKKTLPSTSSQTLDVSSRRTPELVIAFVGAVGSGVTSVADAFSKSLDKSFDYVPHRVKISDFIKHHATIASKPITTALSKPEQIRQMQDIGNELRQQRGSNFLAKLCIENIARWRVKERGYQPSDDELEGEKRLGAALPKRWVHIIDELKHPDEVRMLRDVYGDLFWLVAVMVDEKSMERELEKRGMNKAEAATIIKRDENETQGFGQKVRDTVQLADYFIHNDPAHLKQLDGKALRFLDLIFNIEVITPSLDEAGMSEAFAAAASSACLSRQVGAAAYSEDSELLGVGWNDVPRFGGGLYSSEDKKDNRCFAWGGGICHNDDRKSRLNGQIAAELRKAGLLKDGIADAEIEFALKATDTRSLIEYSRSVHAEMAAILSVARQGKSGLVRGTLYVTTFPCHSCARHIVAAGIRRVVYVEPYPKSLATELHEDAVFSGFGDGSASKVHFEPYEGIAPRNIFRLFKHGIERKAQGKAQVLERTTADPVTKPPLDGFTVFEMVVVKELTGTTDSALDNSPAE
jgi:deoxycytidylate deaminase